MRHPPLWFVRVVTAQPAGDLFGRPGLGPEQLLHVLPQPRAGLGPARLGAAGQLIGPALGPEGAIAPPTPVGRDLPADRAPMAADPSTDHGVGLAPFDPGP